MYGVFANIVFFIHFLWILFLIAGAFWGRKYRPVMIIHGGGLAYAIVSQIFGWYCPLTHLEIRLKHMQDPSEAYTGSFIVHYMEKFVYVEITPVILFVLTVVLVGFNFWMYYRFFKKKI